MMAKALRVLVGYLLACLAAAVVQVLFVMTPAQLSELPSDVAADRISRGAIWALAVATHSAIFAAPLAVVATAMGEWREMRGWLYYALVAIAITMVGYAAQYMGEAASEPSIANNYAFTAFLTSGFVGGLVYWIVAGRKAGNPRAPFGHALRETAATTSARPLGR